MQSSEVLTLKCTHPACGLRFPMISMDGDPGACPRCRSPLVVLHRTPLGDEDRSEYERSPSGLEGFLDNVRSAWNVGSMFRSADGLGLDRMHLAGITPRPDGVKVPKTSLGAEAALQWDYHPDGLAAAQALQAAGRRLWALELHPNAEPIADCLAQLPQSPLVLIVGNEKAGIDPGILEICDRIVYLPMQGVKRSLNVAVAFGIFATLARMARDGVSLAG